MALIEATGLTKHYGQVRALERLDLAGERHVEACGISSG